MASVNKALGSQALFTGSDARLRVLQIPTGVLPIDLLTNGGLPRGRFVELFGPHTTLKSWIALQAVVQVQQAGGVAALADTEHAYDPEWAAMCGINTDELLIVEGETGEEKLDTAELLIRNGLDLLVVDSIAAILPQQEHGKRLHKEGVQPARTAALMSLASRKLTAANSKTCLLWINQLREQVGITFGSNEKTSGGRAMGYYASLRIKISPAGKITEDGKSYDGEKWRDHKVLLAQSYKATVEKSRISGVPQGRETVFDWSVVTQEIDLAKYVFGECVNSGALTNKGSSWRFGETMVVGRGNFQDRMKADPSLMAAMQESLRTAGTSLPSEATTEASSSSELVQPARLGRRALPKKKVDG